MLYGFRATDHEKKNFRYTGRWENNLEEAL